MEKLVLEVEISDFARSLQEGQKELEALKSAYAGVVEASGALSEEAIRAKAAVDAQTKTNRMLQGSLTTLQQANNDLTKDVQANIAAGKAQNNTINENRKAYNALYAIYRDNPTPQLAKDLQHLNRVLKDQEKAVGDTRRNVGNYAESFGEVFTQLGKSGGAFGAATQGIQGINTAFAANPILGVVTAFQELFKILSTNKEVMDAIEQATAYASATFNVIVQRVVDFGKSVGEALSNPKKLIEDFGNLIKENIENRFKAFGLIVDAIAKGDLKALGNAFFQLGTGVSDISGKIERAGQAFNSFANDVTEVASANAAAAKAQQDLDDAIRAANVAQAEQEVTIARLVRQAKDRTKSDEDRIALLQKALSLEMQRAKQEEEIATRQVQILEQQYKGLTLTDEQEDKLADARVKRFNAQKSTFVLQERIQNELNALEAEIAKEKQDRATKETERIQKEEQAKQQIYEKEQARLNALANENARLERLRIEALQQGLQKEEALFELNFETQLEDLRKAGLTEIEIEEYKQRQLADIRAKYRKDDVKGAEDTSKAKIQAQQAELAAAQSISTDLIGLIGQVAAASGASAEFQKALAFVQILIQQAIAIANALTGATASGAATGPAAIATTPAFIATLIGAVTSVIGGAIGLLNQPVPETPKFADGGYTGNGFGSPDDTGHRPAGIVHEGEYVVPKWMVQSPRFGNVISGLESARLGKYADGGFVARASSDNVNNAIMMSNAFKQAVKSLPPAVVSVQEIERVQTNRNRSISVSEL